MEVVLALPV
jgi:hypothetical protein